MIERDVFIAIDSCRAGEAPDFGDVARLPDEGEVSAARGRIEAADRRISVAMHDVATPVGLADRILGRLNGQSSPSADVVEETPALVAAHTAPRRWNRRLILVGMAASAAAVFVAVQALRPPEKPWTASEVLDAAISLYVSNAGPLQPISNAPADFPLSKDVSGTAIGWRSPEARIAGSDVVAYEIEHPEVQRDGSSLRATLYIMQVSTPIEGLSDSAPHRPATPTTQGACAAAWQHGGMLYVLVVGGGEREYRKFIKGAEGPVLITRAPSKVPGILGEFRYV